MTPRQKKWVFCTDKGGYVPGAQAQISAMHMASFLHLPELWRPETAPQPLERWAQGQQLNASPAIVNTKRAVGLDSALRTQGSVRCTDIVVIGQSNLSDAINLE